MSVLGDELLLEGRARDLAREFAPGRALRHPAPLWRQVARQVRADQLGSRVAEHPFERPVHLCDLLVHRDRRDRLVCVLEQIPVALLALSRRFLGARTLDRNARQAGGELDEVEVEGAAVVRLAVVERERAEHRAVGGEDRGRPAGAEPGFQGQTAVVAPQRVARDVRYAHALAPVGGGAARPGRGADLGAVDRLAIGLRQAGGRPVAQMQPVAIE